MRKMVKILLYVILALILACILFYGCTKAIVGMTPWAVPEMLQENRVMVQNRTQSREYYERYSATSAELAWDGIRNYQSSGKVYYLKSAGEMFNNCWSFDPENYQAYWGWGVVSGFRAEIAKQTQDAKFFLEQSVELFKRGKYLQKDKVNIDFELDAANAYNGMGAFYAQEKKQEKAITFLDESKKNLELVLQKDPHCGRAYFLLSVNYYYRGNEKAAKENANEAIRKQFSIPDDYGKMLGIK